MVTLYIPSGLTFSNSAFCPRSVFMCFVWIWEQTEIISLYSMKRLVCITETKCLLRGTEWIFIYRQFNIQQFYVLPTQCIYEFCVDLRTNSDYSHNLQDLCDTQCVLSCPVLSLNIPSVSSPQHHSTHSHDARYLSCELITTDAHTFSITSHTC